MPTYTKKNGRQRVRAAIMVNGVQKKKWFPDDSKQSFRAAAQWEAEQKKQLEKEQEKQAGQTRTSSCLTLHDWLTDHLSYVQPRVSRKTYLEKQGAARRLLAEVKPGLPISQLDHEAITRFLTRQGATRSPNASNKDRKNLATAWEWGRKFLSGFPQNSANLFTMVEKLPEKRQVRYVPPEEDFWAVLDQAKGQDRVMLLTFLHLALRRNEAFSLQWSDIDFANGTVKIGTRKRRGGHMEYDYLPMTNELKKVLLWWWENRPMKRTKHVFTQIYSSPSRWHEPGKPFKSRQHFMKEICALAGVKNFGYHAIRHLSATFLFRAGYKLAVIQRILRHKSPSTTERYLQKLGLQDFEIDDQVFAPKKRILTPNFDPGPEKKLSIK